MDDGDGAVVAGGAGLRAGDIQSRLVGRQEGAARGLRLRTVREALQAFLGRFSSHHFPVTYSYPWRSSDLNYR